jgi:nucleotide-binding universal stress UspA family protein
MFKRILVPLDGSERAERAIPVAARIARASGGSIIFAEVILPPREIGAYSAEHSTAAVKPSAFEVNLAKATSYLTKVVSTYTNELRGIEKEMEVVSGAVSPTLLSIARLEQVDLIVMCSHGETGLKRWVFGSIAQQAVRHSPVPVLVLNEHGVVPPASDGSRPLQALVALDGSPLSEGALEPAAQLITLLAAPAQGALHLLRVVDPFSAPEQLGGQTDLEADRGEETGQEAETYLKAVADRLRQDILADLNLSISTSVATSANVAETIIRLAEQAGEDEDGYSLIALATHGRSGFQRLLMGSVTEQVLGATKLPLLIVRPEVQQAETEREATGEEGTEGDIEGVEEEVQVWVGLL